MADDAEIERQQDLLVEVEPFRYNALMIIKEMVLMSKVLDQRQPRDPTTTVLVDEILHSIFFLGMTKNPPFTPEDILSVKLLNDFNRRYPRPFALCSSKVPRRSPFSCVLDMVVRLTGQDKEGAIRQQLQQFIGRLKGSVNEKPLVSRTICVSQSRSPGSVRFYGVSMSANAARRKKVLIGASCLSMFWDSYVADAVMTFYPERGTEGFARKSYFDGTIQVPENVRCETFDLYDRRLVVKAPCKSCHELFGLTGHTGSEPPHGNCAEAESLSNLFQGDRAVRDQVPPPPGGDRETAERTFSEALTYLVRSFGVFNQWTGGEGGFYTPQ